MPVLLPHDKLAELLGEPRVRSDAATVGELLAEVERRVPAEAWRAARQAAVLVNGRNIHYLQGMRTPLLPDDQVWMVWPACGG
jgi:molybdopterin converting factor small subunit